MMHRRLRIAASLLATVPIPLGPANHAALTGDTAVLSNTHGQAVDVTRVPLAGGAATSLLAYEAPAGLRPRTQFAASPQRAGLVVLTADRKEGSLRTAQAFLGDPLVPLGDPVDANGRAFIPVRFAMAGSAAILSGLQGKFAREVDRVIEADGTQSTLDLPDTVSAVDFAGDLVAYGQRTRLESEEDPPTHLVVKNRRTGETVRDLRVKGGGIMDLDLREDGAVVLRTDGGGIVAVRPGKAPVQLAKAGAAPTWAGDRVVAIVRTGQPFWSLKIIDTDGRQRALGTPSRYIANVTADGNNVVWRANGCVLTTPVTAPPATAIGPGACAHSEAMVVETFPKLTRTLPVRVRCLVATATCTGTLRSPAGASRRFDIPPATTVKVPLRLRAAVYRRLRRTDASDTVSVSLVIDDGRTAQAQVLVDVP